MAYHYTAGGEIRLVIDRAFKQTVNDLSNRHRKEGYSPQEIRQEILRHPFLMFDDWKLAELADEADELKKIGERISALRAGVLNGHVTQVIDGDKRGTPELTAAKLQHPGRKIRGQVIDPQKTLLEVERHPFGGYRRFVQWWLWDQESQRLRHLMDEEAEIVPGPDPGRAGSTAWRGADGVWHHHSQEKKEAFWTLVEKLVFKPGREALESRVRVFQDLRAHPDDEVKKALREKETIDWNAVLAERAEARAVRDKRRAIKLGPKPASETTTLDAFASTFMLKARLPDGTEQTIPVPPAPGSR